MRERRGAGVLAGKGIIRDMENPQVPGISGILAESGGEDTGGKPFRVKMLFVVILTDPVLERSCAIELGGTCGNIVWMVWNINGRNSKAEEKRGGGDVT